MWQRRGWFIFHLGTLDYHSEADCSSSFRPAKSASKSEESHTLSLISKLKELRGVVTAIGRTVF